MIMFRLLALLLILISISSCKKTSATAPQLTSGCGRANMQNGLWKVKYIVTGSNSPSSVIFNMNAGQSQFGTYYYKTFNNPSLPLSDSLMFCGEVSSDIILNLMSSDTIQFYTAKIFVNDSLYCQKTSNKGISLVGQCF